MPARRSTPNAMTQPQLATPIGIGIVGLGVMGQTHLRAVRAAAAAGLPCRLAAVCDADPARLTGRVKAAGNIQSAGDADLLFDPAVVRAHADPAAFFADPAVHAVCICTYTDTHVDMALRALASGKHVLVEKPVALSEPPIRELARAALTADRLCMPAMCMRYWPGWDWLHEAVRSRRYGRVRSAAFQRLGSGPAWGQAFYRDTTRSGGALYDLHIHDADFIHWCFGPPASVAAHGSVERLTTAYRYDGPDAPLVTAEGGWDLAPTAGFRMKYLVAFETATADFDLSRQPPLLLHTAAGSEPVPVSPGSGYENQCRGFVHALTGGPPPRATLDDAALVARTLGAEHRSLHSGLPASP